MKNLYLLSVLLFSLSLTANAYDIAYLALGHDKGHWQVWLLDSKTKKTKQLSKTAYDKNRISWHPNKRKLLVSAREGNIMWINARSGRESAIKIPVGKVSDAVLSPNGESIAFSSSPAKSQGNNEIWLYKIAPKKLLKLTNFRKRLYQPTWDSAGNNLYFLFEREEKIADIWKINLITRNKTRLTRENLYHFDIASNQLGDLLYSKSQAVDNYNIWLWKNREKPTQITIHAGLEASPSWAEDNKRFVFHRSSGEGVSDIWLFNIQTGQQQQLTKQDGAGAIRPVWYHKYKKRSQ